MIAAIVIDDGFCTRCTAETERCTELSPAQTSFQTDDTSRDNSHHPCVVIPKEVVFVYSKASRVAPSLHV